jgi:DNA-directed RNA polymerase specialized sigma24 family protein
MNQDERPEDHHGQDELIAAFAALGGRLTEGELIRLLGSDEYYGALARLAALLLDGDSAAAGDVARDSLAAVQHAWPRLGGDPGRVRAYLRQAVVNRARSIRRRRAIDSHDPPDAAPDAPGAGQAAIGGLGREPWMAALRALPVRQREAVVLHTYLGLSARQAAQAMGISAGRPAATWPGACHRCGARPGCMLS